MNKIFNLIWSKTKEKWIVVSEKVKGNGKVPTSPLLSIAVLTALFSSGGVAYGIDASTLPTGGQITSGSGTITSSGTQMTVNQATQKMIANWATFNIGENAAVRFEQPGIAAVALNRIADKNPSQIMGSLTSNGQVFLLNSSGIIFGKTATVNVGGLVASSLNLLDADFLAGNDTFSNNGSSGAILNQGEIKALDGGVVALMAPKVTNEGSITANSGSVLLAAGNQVTLDFTGDGLINYTVDQGAVDALVENRGLIKADGGVVVMTARAADALKMSTVNNSGVIEARTLQNKAGRILLLSDLENGQALVSGTLDASAPDGGDGGFIETSGGRVNISDGTVVTTKATQGKTGTWLIDPDGFTIAASGGDMTGAALSSSLSGTDIEIQSTVGGSGSDGNINVNDTVTWSENTLTLTATNDINVNAVMTATDASLVLNYGEGGNLNMGFNTDGTFKGRVDFLYTDEADKDLTPPRFGSGFLTINGNDYYVIDEIEGLSEIDAGDSDVYYALGSNIEAGDTVEWNDGLGFEPIGLASQNFEGVFDGLGHTISGLTIDRSEDQDNSNIGLFSISSGIIRNVGLVDASVKGEGNIGALVGQNDNGTISNSYVSGGSVVGSGDSVGGLVGCNYGTITNSHSSATVSGDSSVGGLVGEYVDYYDVGSITDSYATGSVTGVGDDVGGLVGYSWGKVTNSFYKIDSVNHPISVGDDWGGSVVADVTPFGINGDLFADWLSTTGGKAAKTLDISKYFTLSGGYYLITKTTGLLSDKGDLRNILGFVNDTSENHFRLTTDLALPSGFWIPLFNAAELDGAGFKFTGLTVNQPMNSQIGMIGDLGPTSTINNLGVTGITVTGDEYVGGLVGWNEGDITSSHATGAVTMSGDYGEYAGGLVGYNDGNITSSYATGSVHASGYDCSYVGGLVGYNDGDITGSHATGNVEGSNYVGGLVGVNGYSGTINSSYATGDVTGEDGEFIGGLVGGNYGGDINSSYATGIVTGGDYVGGLVGSSNYNEDESRDPSISDSYATGSVVGNGDYVGGLVGFNYHGTITSSYATGNVEGSNYVGGLVGFNYNSTITSSYATGAVNGSDSVGGLVGYNYNSTITSSYATGAVKGDDYVGGLVGYNYGDIISSYATGSVEGGNSIGGLAGRNYDEGNISKSYATGTVTGGDYVGGLVGYNDFGDISSSFATGSVEGGEKCVGGLVGDNYGYVTDTYATGSVTGSGSGNRVGGLVGYNYGGEKGNATITNSYARGIVTGGSDVGALVGRSGGEINDSYYESGINSPEAKALEMTGVGNQDDAPGYVWGMSTADMKLVENYTTSTAANGNPESAPEWNFDPAPDGIWKIDSANDGYPYLAWQSPDAPAPETGFERPPVLDEPKLVDGPLFQGAPTIPPSPSIVEGQMLEVDLLTPQSGSEPGLIGVSVPQSLWMPGAVFSFELPEQVKGAASGGDVAITLLDGTPLPSWLHYNPETMTFTATDVPQGAAGVKLLVKVNGKSWEIDVSVKPS